MTPRTILCTVIAFCTVPALAWAQEDGGLAEKAKKILQTHCYRCHGENGAVEGGVNYLLDRNQLVSRHKVVPKEPAKSRIIKRIVNEEMPPDDEKNRPSAAELATLKAWIAAGAPDFNPPLAQRAFLTHEATLLAVQKDLAKLSAHDQLYTRYFTFTHLYNAGLSEDELTTYRQGLSKLVNSLSWGKRVVPPAAVDAAKTILRIDLRDYKWSPKTWELLEAHYPYGLLVSTDAEQACQKGSGTRLPFLRGDWFVASAALPPLYHDLLGLPLTDRVLEKELRVNVADNLRDGETLRAAFNGSGVSRNNRLIERHASLFGGYWKSYDFASNTDRQNLFASPLGPGVRASAFKHDGGEIIFSLPNGLQGYLLVDAHGRRIDKGPTEIVSDPRRPDRTVVNGLSCMSCHSRGIILKDDQIRPHVEKNKQAFLKDELEQILALYPTRARMRKIMETDAARFREAVEKTGCRPGSTEPVAALTLRFEAEMDLTLAAAELGLTDAQLRQRFEKSVTLGRLLGPLAIQGGTVQREVFTNVYAQIVQELELGKALPPERRSHFTWSAPDRPPNWKPKVVDPDPFVKPKPPRTFAATPGARFEDPWYYQVFSHESGQLHAVAVSPKDKWLTAVEARAGLIVLFHRDHHANWASMAGHKGSVLALDFAPDGFQLASGGIDQTAKLWDAGTGRERHTLGGHAGFVRAVRFSPDGRWVATGSERVRLWDAATGEQKAAFAQTPGWVESLAFAPDGRMIASASKTVQLWNTASGKLVTEIAGHQGEALSVAFSPDGKLLAYGTSDGLIHLWDRAAGKVRSTLKGHQRPVSSLAFSRNGKLLVSVSKPTAARQPGEFKAWDPETGTELAAQTGHTEGISCVALSPDDCHAVTAGLDGHLRYRDLMYLGKTPLGPFAGHSLPATGAAFTRDGRLAVTCGADRTVRVWDAKSGAQLQRLEGHTLPVRDVVLTDDGKFAYTGGADKTLRKWNLTTGKEVQRWTVPTAVMELTQSADGKTMAVVCQDGVRVMDVDSGKALKLIKGPERAVALSADGRRLAGAAFRREMRVWDVATGGEIAALGTGQTFYSSAVFSADGKRLLTGDHDNAVCLWDIDSGKEVARYKGCTRAVHSVAFCDNGKRILASCGALKTPVVKGRPEYDGCAVLLWDADGKEVCRWDTHPGVVRRLAVCAANPVVLFLQNDGIKRVPLP